MCGSFLTYTRVAVTWIFLCMCFVTGHDDHGHHDHCERDYMYEPHLRDYHYDQDRYDYGKHDDPPPSRDRLPPIRDWPPPPPKNDRPPPPPPPPPRSDEDDKLPIIYMEDHCRLHLRTFFLDDARVYVDETMHVKLTKDPSRQHPSSCVVTFSTRDPDWRLLLHFERVDINYNPGTVDRFRIYDGKDIGKELTPPRGLYGKYSKGIYEFSSGNIKDYVSSGQELTLYFIGSPSEDFRGFELLLTVFKDPSLNNQCDPGYLKCKVNGYCISESLYCNGAQNCGNDDFSDSRGCSHHDRDDDDDPNAMFHGPTDIGLMVGCALSIVILMVVIIWLGVICLKKKGFDRMRRHYARQEDSDGAAAPDGTIVEPAQIHRVMSPPVTFMEPPPLYSENDDCNHGSSEEGSYPSGRFELPPPYSPVDDRDTAGLILNQSDNRNQRTVPTHIQPQVGVHQGTNQTRAPTPPIRTSSIPSHNSDSEGHLRLRHNSGAPSAFRPLTGITRQQSKDEQAACPPTPKILHSDDSGIPSSSSLNGSSTTDGAMATQTAGTQTNNVEGSSDNMLACHIDNEFNESMDKNVSVA